MQFITWDEFYEKNKNNITDKQAAYEEYLRIHRSFIESISTDLLIFNKNNNGYDIKRTNRTVHSN
jgi:hypothetical protein